MPSCQGSARACRTGGNGSSSTSSRTSTSSSTSEAAARGGRRRSGPTAGVAARLSGFVRLTHPFPSLLDGVVTAGLALLAGAPIITALRLGLSMVALQAAIGTVNDVVDAPRDAGRPAKPIPAGIVSQAAARSIALGAGAAGVVLAAPSGPIAVAIAVAILVVGLAYDIRFKGTAWSWLPFAVGIPLLPVFAWVGAGRAVPMAVTLLVPVAAGAGAALAVANALADLDRDRASGTDSVATRLGANRAWLVHAALHALVVLAAAASIAILPAHGDGLSRPFGTLAVALGAAVLAGGAWLLRGRGVRRRQAGWAAEAIGVGLLAAGWVASVVGPR